MRAWRSSSEPQGEMFPWRDWSGKAMADFMGEVDSQMWWLCEEPLAGAGPLTPDGHHRRRTTPRRMYRKSYSVPSSVRVQRLVTVSLQDVITNIELNYNYSNHAQHIIKSRFQIIGHSVQIYG